MANPIIAAVLSFLIPGLGQAYAGDIKKGVIFFIIMILFVVVGTWIFNSLVVHLLGFIYALYTAYDAYQMAK